MSAEITVDGIRLRLVRGRWRGGTADLRDMANLLLESAPAEACIPDIELAVARYTAEKLGGRVTRKPRPHHEPPGAILGDSPPDPPPPTIGERTP